MPKKPDGDSDEDNILGDLTFWLHTINFNFIFRKSLVVTLISPWRTPFSGSSCDLDLKPEIDYFILAGGGVLEFVGLHGDGLSALMGILHGGWCTA